MRGAVRIVSFRFLIFLVVCSWSNSEILHNYCKLAAYEACIDFGNQHLGCEKGMITNFTTGRKKFIRQFPNFLEKTIFTDKINDLRNEVATGTYGLLGGSAANMKVVNWDDEFQYLAGISLEKLSINSQKFCPITDSFKNVTKVTQYFSQFVNNIGEIHIPDIMEEYFIKLRNTLTSGLQGVERLSVVVDAWTEAVGCAIGTYVTDDGLYANAIIMTCFFNQRGGKNFREIYFPGKSCTRCNCIEICSTAFPNLCEYYEAQDEEPAEFCESEDTIDKLITHFKIIYTFVFIGLITHFVLFCHYSRLET